MTIIFRMGDPLDYMHIGLSHICTNDDMNVCNKGLLIKFTDLYRRYKC